MADTSVGVDPFSVISKEPLKSTVSQALRFPRPYVVDVSASFRRAASLFLAAFEMFRRLVRQETIGQMISVRRICERLRDCGGTRTSSPQSYSLSRQSKNPNV